jgi:hypothetical protein
MKCAPLIAPLGIKRVPVPFCQPRLLEQKQTDENGQKP